MGGLAGSPTEPCGEVIELRTDWSAERVRSSITADAKAGLGEPEGARCAGVSQKSGAVIRRRLRAPRKVGCNHIEGRKLVRPKGQIDKVYLR